MPPTMSIQKSFFGTTADGQPVDLYTLTNAAGMIVKIITFGGRITEWHVPDRDGKAANIVLGFDNLKQYESPEPYFGAIIGRYANRIAGAQFTLDGQTYTLAKNAGDATLHGGLKAFDKRVWAARPSDSPDGPRLELTYLSPDGEEGFPGNLRVSVTYTLSPANELKIDYHATTDRPTPLNLTNPSYFNLAGAGGEPVLDHVVMIAADEYTPSDENLITTGQIATVHGTPLDFTTPHRLGERLQQMTGGPKVGYDNNFVLRNATGALTHAARLEHPASGRTLEVFTTEPAIQLYTGNFLDGTLHGLGGTYQQYGAVCLETQHNPDSVHHRNFPSTLLRPGESFRSTTIYQFPAE
jgi:aldose 1-epimerase